MRLKLLPSSPQESGVYILAAAFGQPGDAFDLAPVLADCGGVKRIIVFDAAFVSPPTEYLKNLFSGAEEHAAYVLFTIDGDPGRLDSAAMETAEICHRKGALETLVAAATYQKEMVNAALESILAGLAAEHSFYQETDSVLREEISHRPGALVWQSDPALCKIFYPG